MDTLSHHHHHHHQNLATEKKSFETKHGTTTTTATSTSVQGIKEVKSLSSSSSLPSNNSSKKQVTISSSSSPASPPSASSSPSHEFSFTISLSTNNNKATTTTHTTNNSNSNSNNSFAVDLSPADDIFFHGHLLPLHLLSHLPVSPRSSTNSMDSFTLPIKEISSSSSSSIMEDIRRNKQSKDGSATATATATATNGGGGGISAGQNGEAAAARNKPNKSFSLFGLSKWRKGQFRGRDYNDGSCINNNIEEEEEEEEDYYGKEKGPKRSKVKFELSHVIKRYMRMVRPLLFSRARRESIQLRRQPHSFSGVLGSGGSSSNNISKRELMRGRRGEYSAPASMWTSPSNSGLLVATPTAPAAASDSSMEELQAAIQAAIAHCKNSINNNNNNVTEDKVVKC